MMRRIKEKVRLFVLTWTIMKISKAACQFYVLIVPLHLLRFCHPGWVNN